MKVIIEIDTAYPSALDEAVLAALAPEQATEELSTLNGEAVQTEWEALAEQAEESLPTPPEAAEDPEDPEDPEEPTKERGEQTKERAKERAMALVEAERKSIVIDALKEVGAKRVSDLKVKDVKPFMEALDRLESEDA